MIQLFMKRSGSPVIVPLNLPASHDAMTEAASQLDEASRAGKTEIVEIKSDDRQSAVNTSADSTLIPECSLHS
mgnify:CR=1 FL=1